MKRLAAAAAMLMAVGAARADEIPLLMSTYSAPNSTIEVQFFAPWAKAVNDRAQGAIRVELRAGTSLANPFNAYDRLINDVLGVGWVLHNYVGGKFALSEIGALPFAVDDYKSEYASATLWRVYKSGALDAEYDQVVPLIFSILTQSQLHTIKPMKNLDSMAGLKIIGPAKHYGEVISALGGAPLTLQISDYYEALARGTADGVVTGFTAFPNFKLGEVVFYHVDTSLGTASAMIFVSKKKLAALPQPGRDALLANSGEKLSRELGLYFERTDEQYRNLMRSTAGHQVVELSKAQEAAWKKRIAPAIDAILAARPNGRAVYEKFVATYAEVKAGR